MRFLKKYFEYFYTNYIKKSYFKPKFEIAFDLLLTIKTLDHCLVRTEYCQLLFYPPINLIINTKITLINNPKNTFPKSAKTI